MMDHSQFMFQQATASTFVSKYRSLQILQTDKLEASCGIIDRFLM